MWSDSIRNAIDISVHPNSAIKKSWGFGGALGKYYPVAVVPLILKLVLIAIFGTIAGQAAGTLLPGAVGSLLGLTISYLTFVWVILDYIIFLPIGIIIFAAVTHVIGRFFGSFRSNDFNTTFSAFIYGIMPGLLLSWIPVISTIGWLWTIVITIIALSKLQNTTRLHALANLAIAGVVLFVVLAIVFVAIGIGIFSLATALHYLPTTSPVWNVTSAGSVLHTGV
jgi:hypothetical protein